MKLIATLPLNPDNNEIMPAAANLAVQMRLSDIHFSDDADADSSDGTLEFLAFMDTDAESDETVLLAKLTTKNGTFVVDAGHLPAFQFIEWLKSCVVEPVGLGASLYVLFNRDKGFAMLHSTDRGLTFPGGKIEPGETPAQACAREVMEETGMIAKVDESFYFQMMCGKCICHVFVKIEDDASILPDAFGPSKEFEHEGKGIWMHNTVPSKYPSFNHDVLHTVYSLHSVRNNVNERIEFVD